MRARRGAKACDQLDSRRVPVPQIMEEAPAPAERRAHASARPTAARGRQAPALPPPLNIGPAPGATKSAPARSGKPAAGKSPTASARSALETLFGVQR